MPGALHSSETLPLLYQGLLTGIVRIQAQRQPVPEAFRRRTNTALEEVERHAIAAGYDGRDVRDTHFAVVAFLDAVVLNSSDPIRAEWERKTLQEELFGKTDAGVVFFEKLEHFRSSRDSQQLADVLEVYLLCLLLGFEGRYSGGLRAELDSIIEKVTRRIEDIRGSERRISPEGYLPAETAPAPHTDVPRIRRLRLIALAAIIFTVLFFLALKLDLIWAGDRVRSGLL